MHPFINKIPFVFAGACMLGSVLGISVYSWYVHREGPVWVVNQFLGVVLAAILFVFSAQPFLYMSLSRADVGPRMRLASLVVCGFVVLVSIVLFVGYSIGRRGDGIAWSILIVLVNLLNFVLLRRQYESMKAMQSYMPLNVSIEEPPPSKLRLEKIAIYFNRFMKAITIIVLVCLLGGAYSLAYGYDRYGPRGNFAHVKYDDSREQKIHYLCEGPLSDRPTFWFEVGGGHTLCDFYGLQYFLTKNNYRSCIYDRPGFGWSDYMLPNQPYWYEKMINATGERGPFVVVGWAAGGDITFPFVAANPHLVHSWVLFDVAYPNEEWGAAQYENNWTDAQTQAYKNSQLKQRYQIFDIIRAIATPFGWMSLFYAPDKSTFIPADRYNEFLWHTKLEKHWTSQYFMLVKESTTESPMMNITTFPSTINVVSISSYMNQSMVCDQQKLDIHSTACDMAWRNTVYWYLTKRQLFDELVSFTNTSATNLWIECDGCDLGFPVEMSEWTAMTLLNIFNNSML